MLKFLKQKYVIAVLLVLFLGGAAIISYGFVPVMKVEGKFVTLAQFLKVYSAIRRFDGISQKTPSTDADLKKRAFMNIIETRFLDIVVEKTGVGLRQEAGNLAEKAVAERKSEFEEASQRLYGLSAAEFEKLVLLPQAEKEVLEKHYENNQADLEKNWAEIYKTSEVKIYYPGFEWKDGEVKIKNKK